MQLMDAKNQARPAERGALPSPRFSVHPCNSPVRHCARAQPGRNSEAPLPHSAIPRIAINRPRLPSIREDTTRVIQHFTCSPFYP